MTSSALASWHSASVAAASLSCGAPAQIRSSNSHLGSVSSHHCHHAACLAALQGKLAVINIGH